MVTTPQYVFPDLDLSHDYPPFFLAFSMNHRKRVYPLLPPPPLYAASSLVLFSPSFLSGFLLLLIPNTTVMQLKIVTHVLACLLASFPHPGTHSSIIP